MKKLCFLILLFISASVGREIYGYFSSLSGAFEGYKDHAAKMARSGAHEQTLEPVEGHLVDVSYILESVKREGRNNVRLAAIQSLHYETGFGVGNWGDRRIAKTRHDVIMVRKDGRWQISELQRGVTEITRLADSLGTE